MKILPLEDLVALDGDAFYAYAREAHNTLTDAEWEVERKKLAVLFDKKRDELNERIEELQQEKRQLDGKINWGRRAQFQFAVGRRRPGR
jgi:hypothetical protein